MKYRAKLGELDLSPPEPDDRLRLFFTCCHPALARAAQIALTLRVVFGLTTARVRRLAAGIARSLAVAQESESPRRGL